MKMEDFVICKAFILTSKDPIIGMSQKGKQFQDVMLITYDKLIKNQCKEDRHKHNKAPKSLKAFMLVLVPYQEQFSNSISSCFIIMKFMGIKSIMLMESGQNQYDYSHACKDYRACKEYLESKPKWSCIQRP